MKTWNENLNSKIFMNFTNFFVWFFRPKCILITSIVYYSKILTLLCTSKHYIMIEDIFVVIAFKILEKHTIKSTKKGENFKFKNYRRKINLLFMNYVDFESISKKIKIKSRMKVRTRKNSVFGLFWRSAIDKRISMYLKFRINLR